MSEHRTVYDAHKMHVYSIRYAKNVCVQDTNTEIGVFGSWYFSPVVENLDVIFHVLEFVEGLIWLE